MRRHFLCALAAVFAIAFLLAGCGGGAGAPLVVTFDSQGGESIESASVSSGMKISEPLDLTNGDLVFSGWYTEADCVNRWDFAADVVTEDITLYAKWNAADSLTFKAIDGGAAYEVSKGAAAPENDLYIPAFYKGIPVTSIGNLAFSDCGSLTSVRLPPGLISILECAFQVCTSLTRLDIPASVTCILPTCLLGCASLSGIHVDPGNARYTSIDGVLFDKCVSTLLWYPAGRSGSTYEIPAGVTCIGRYAFSESHLTGVNLPTGLTIISKAAFLNCLSLVGIFIPSSVSAVDQAAFSGCISLSIRCQAAKRPPYWDVDWNVSNCDVTWGCSS